MLHRDVSFNNILIYEYLEEVNGEKIVKRKGLLNDWDLSQYKEDMTEDKLEQPNQFVRYSSPPIGLEVADSC